MRTEKSEQYSLPVSDLAGTGPPSSLFYLKKKTTNTNKNKKQKQWSKNR